jgi:hypothetical protein
MICFVIGFYISKKTVNRQNLAAVYAERADDKELKYVIVKSGGKNRIDYGECQTGRQIPLNTVYLH